MYSPKLDEDIQQKLIDKIYDLYIYRTDKYLKQNPGKEFMTLTKGKTTKKPLLPFMIKAHLEQNYTIGTFAGKGKNNRTYTKFICFDVDLKEDDNLAKWFTYKVAETLREMGINEYYISHSGGKGYHIEVFFEDLIPVKLAYKFYLLVLRFTDLYSYSDKGKIEFRPTEKEGVKLPLGLNQKYYQTGGYCGFCSEFERLRMLDEQEEINYFLNIQKIKRKKISKIVKKYKNYFEESNKKIQENKKTGTIENEIEETGEVLEQYQELGIYNQTEDEIFSKAMDYYRNGLKRTGTRHNVCLLLAKFLRYNGLEKGEAEQELKNWMKRQDEKTYRTPLEDSLKDIEKIVNWVYENNKSLVPPKKDLSISFDEINTIVTNCPQKNQKLLMYALLVHSKRYATEGGVFYMTFKQMEETTGLGFRTVFRQINELEELKMIEVVERNGKNFEYDYSLQKPISKPNRYRIKMKNENQSEKIELKDNFQDCLLEFYSDKQLKDLLPRRQYQYFIS
ncbi:TOTE conflict system archaeo-eukaryotic primase domain-containing protein [Natranaerobius thermophilus]|uniref:TOTE conflict system primase domain-containing protein n=1 Tax=Natranaerobius thermophilus (strain ATCC BAA-1301 / DSM 18059 / JW/NM-WN-LF) TaxID=457570 RepID=B2A218_NATTJ|nr:hypothetical protein [Natranaerobius thermophilus]ACB84823.1 hypothetical protein Nther_1240 [Natranaerobius thermophilus JW/NM-WN-LF]